MTSARDTRAQTTVYPHNNRAGAAAAVAAPGDWHPLIDALVQRDYAFHAATYGDDGFLFRGVDAGLEAALAAGYWHRNGGDHPLAALERETGVMFVSQDLSDALAVARLWETTHDAAVLVIPAAAFTAALAVGTAAMLAFADPGVVFKYPFFVPPLPLAAVAKIIVSPARGEALVAHGGAQAGLCVAPELDPAASTRADYEAAITALCAGHGYHPAVSCASRRAPGPRAA